MERLQKFLAHAGIGSRRKCEELIIQGRVQINGKITNKLGVKIDPNKDIVKVDGILVKNKEEKVYILLNKPKGYLTTVKDDRNRLTVINLLKNINFRVYPVGRLDYDSEGLLLLTNDGELAFRLTHPRYKVYKTYEVLVKGQPGHKKIELLARGVKLEDGLTAPAVIKIKKKLQEETLIDISIREGRNRQVRRMFDYIDYPVINLKRISMGPLKLSNLPTGKYRFLSKKEIKQLKKIVSLI